MRRALVLALATCSILGLSAAAARGDGPTVVDLMDRVPRRWLSNHADQLPIQSPRLLRTLPRRCRTRGGYREHCQGPRRVPLAHGAEGDLARRLALGRRATVLQLRQGGAFDEWLAAAQATDDESSLTWPVPDGHLGRGFGRVRRGELRHRKHFGIDIGAEEGTPVLAARGGLVVYSDNGLTGFGNAVMILHEDDTTTFYAHCHATHVFAGQRVSRAQPIAEVGQTGFAERPHLHFEWRLRGWARDPMLEMQRDRR